MRKMLSLGLSVAASAIVLSAPAFAAVAVQNGSFEEAGNSTDHWIFDGNSGTFSPAASDIVVNGTYAAFGNYGAYFAQDLGSMVAGQTYSLTMGFGYRTDGTPAGTNFDILLRENAPDTGTDLAYAYGPDEPNHNSPNNGIAGTAATTPVAGSLTDTTLTYTATLADAGHDLYYVVVPNSTQIVADNLRLTSTPEPAALSMLAVASLNLLARRRRRVV